MLVAPVLVAPALIAAAVVAAATACSGEPDRTPRNAVDSATRVAIAAESASAAAVAALPPSSVWDVDRVSERLVRAGVGPRRLDSVPPAPAWFAGATAAAFAVARDGEVRVYIYADSLARRAVTGTLDPLTAAPAGAPSPWPSEPLLIIAQNMAAVMLGSTAVQRERVQLALEAGLPVGR